MCWGCISGPSCGGAEWTGGVDYIRRVVDGELDDLLPDLAAISLDGPKGVGKTATASRGPTWCSGWTTAPTTRSSTPT